MIRRLLVAGLAVVVESAAVFAYLTDGTGGGTEVVSVEIPRGATTAQVGELLRADEVIGSVLGFRILTRLRGLEGRIQAGRYEMTRDMGSWDALGVLRSPPIEKGTTVPFPPGFSVKQVAERVAARTQIKDLHTIATNGTVRAGIMPPGVNTLEGLLYPDTYFVGERETATDLARRMVAEFDRRTADLDWTHPESRNLSRYQAVIVASLIEREARVPEDRAKIAAVIYNRMQKGMRLQIDITALYGLDEHKVPTRADLRRPSPYNTYLIDGLPPTPIANPGLDAIEAALAPANIDALYYVVIDPSGKHGFTADPNEFERLKQRRPPEVH